MSIGRNSSCPCGSAKKHKNCCDGKVDWKSLLAGKSGNPFVHMTTRGKNLAFYGVIGDVLQLDSLEKPLDWRSIKRACTPNTVKKIHEGILDIWPSEMDLNRIFEDERRVESGLYVGRYESEAIFKGLTRHSIYSDRILLIDPFTYPGRLKSEYNPIENPQKHGINTLQCLRLWFELLPWVEAGLVGFIRKPEDFDTRLGREAALRSKILYEGNSQLAPLLDKAVLESQHSRDYDEFKEFVVLSMHDDEISQGFLEDNPNADYSEAQEIVKHVKMRRERHPYYINLFDDNSGFKDQLTVKSSGTSYYVAKLIAAATGSHIITDIAPRWKEIEIDRGQSGVELGPWTPFSKAFQNVGLNFLEDVPLKNVLELRRQNRLEGMRGFLRKAWRASKSDNPFSEENAVALADELREKISEAEDEWGKIDRDLAQMLAVEGGATMMAASSGIAAGNAGLFVGGGVLAGFGTAASSWMRRRSFPDRYPAAFFLGLK